MKGLAVVACLHGVEPYGLEVCKKIPEGLPYFIGNQKAIEKKVRFLETDLNRCFPGKADGTHEEKLAFNLVGILKDFDYVIDLHSTKEVCPLFGIITNVTKEKIDFAKKLGLKKVVLMSPEYASGKSLIDFVKCGISFEVGPHNRKENVSESLELISNFVEGKHSEEEMEIYGIFDIVRGNVSKVLMKNFKVVKKGEVIALNRDGSFQKASFDFVPVLVGKKNYNDVIALAAKKINLAELF